LANATHVKNVPGRKTDVNDATWLDDLMAHGLIRPSFVPDEPTQQMRDLLRTRKQFVRERSNHIQRIQKRWKMPTSSWIRSSPTSLASPAAA
jgi:transposase